MTGESDSQIMSAGVGLVCVCVGGVGGGVVTAGLGQSEKSLQ